MPTYRFRCDLDHTYERRVPMGTESAVCPTCKGEGGRLFTLPSQDQIMSRVGFQYTRSQFVKARDKGKWAGWKARE